ncbi:hypothetical protein WMY93_000783 [Mugilogobius chulae]|uniref:Uncharacterized protein n=1 Tax=Mugilogobius chulae TaxID=88201 RepID=A0AAW0QB22_9GOBI
MQSLASEILRYKPYPSDLEFDDVCKALVGTYPFLRERGSETGYSAWKITLKQKMGNYRSNLRNMGCSELKINSLQGRSEGNAHPNMVKKARRAEVNFCPDYPAGENKESQEEDRVALLTEIQKRNNDEQIKTKMEKTFPLRRQEILQDMPFIADFKSRWPALFSSRELLMVDNKRWRSDNQGSNSSSMEPSVSSVTNGTHSSLNSEMEEEELACSIDPTIQNNPYIQFNGHPSVPSLPAGINVKSTDSDNEEFCDSMEHLAVDEGLPMSKLSAVKNTGPSDGIRTVDFKSAMSRRWTNTSGSTCDSQSDLNVHVPGCYVSQSTQSLCSSRENVNEQIATALLRLQHDMDSVLQQAADSRGPPNITATITSLDQRPLAAARQAVLVAFTIICNQCVFHSNLACICTWLVQLYCGEEGELRDVTYLCMRKQFKANNYVSMNRR